MLYLTFDVTTAFGFLLRQQLFLDHHRRDVCGVNSRMRHFFISKGNFGYEHNGLSTSQSLDRK